MPPGSQRPGRTGKKQNGAGALAPAPAGSENQPLPFTMEAISAAKFSCFFRPAGHRPCGDPDFISVGRAEPGLPKISLREMLVRR